MPQSTQVLELLRKALHQAELTTADYRAIIPLCDALVGDTACHIRAILLIGLYRKLEKSKTLTTEQNEFVKNNSLLTLATAKHQDLTLLTLYEKSDYSSAKAKQLKLSSGKVLTKLAQQAKTNLAQYGVDKFRKYAKKYQASAELKLENDEIDILEKDIFIEYCPGKKMPVVACYIAGQILMSILKHKKVLLAVNVVRGQFDTTPALNVQGRISTFYRCQDNQFKVINAEEINDDELVFVFDALCFYGPNADLADHTTSDVFTEQNIEIFRKEFEKLDIEKLILLNMVAHDQFPGSVKNKDEAYIHKIKSSEIYREAEKYRLNDMDSHYSTYSVDAEQRIMINRNLLFRPFVISHAYATTALQCKSQTEAVNACLTLPKTLTQLPQQESLAEAIQRDEQLQQRSLS